MPLLVEPSFVCAGTSVRTAYDMKAQEDSDRSAPPSSRSEVKDVAA
jgi:hypothetical protein